MTANELDSRNLVCSTIKPQSFAQENESSMETRTQRTTQPTKSAGRSQRVK
jgi:hypothetical protein